MGKLCEKCRRAPASTAKPAEIVDAVSALGACYHEWIGGEYIRCRIDIFCGDTLETRRRSPLGYAYRAYDVANARTEVLRAFLGVMEPPGIRALREVVTRSERGQIVVANNDAEASP